MKVSPPKSAVKKSPVVKTRSRKGLRVAIGDMPPAATAAPSAPSPTTDKILFYTMPGCGPCEMVKELLKKDPASAEHFEIVSLGTPSGKKRIESAGIQRFPTFVRKDGAMKVGAEKLAKLIAWSQG